MGDDMGNKWGFGGFLCLFVVNLLSSQAYGESSTLSLLLAPLMVGVTERTVDEEYAKQLNIDPHATVALSQGTGLCTGTFLSSTTAITAVHCVDRENPTGNVNVDGIASLQVFFSERYQTPVEHGDLIEGRIKYDVAVLVFPPGTGEFLGIKSYPKLATTDPKSGDTVYLVGFGMSDPYAFLTGDEENAGAGIKGWGTATISETKDGMLFTEPITIENKKPVATETLSVRPNTSRGLPGDSGGALYNTQGEIVGITSVVAKPVQDFTESKVLFGLLSLVHIDSWKVSNEYADVTSHDTLELMATATHCKDLSRCAVIENSRPEIKTVSLEKPSAPNSTAFDHVILRTGFYGGTKNVNRRAFLHPVYYNKQMVQIDLLELDGKTPQKVETLTWNNGAYVNSAISKVLATKKDRFRQFIVKGHPDPRNPNRLALGLDEEFEFRP